MKLKALLAALAAAALCVSVASASPPGKGDRQSRGHDSTQNDGSGKKRDDSKQSERTAKRSRKDGDRAAASCKGRQVVLRGVYVSGSAGAEGAGSFVMVIKKVNGHGKKGLAGKQATVTVDSHTKFRRHGAASLSDLVANDRLSVKARLCRAATSGDPDATEPAVPTLLARKVDARPAKAGGDTDTTPTDTTPTDTTLTDTEPETDTGPSPE